MDPVSLATLGTTILGTLSGYSSQRKQLNLQKEQLALQKQVAADQKALSDRMIQLGLATQIDAQGNVTVYDEASNSWKVIPSEMTKQLMSASNTEELMRLTQDAPMARGENIMAARRRAMEGSTADTLMLQAQDKIAGRTGLQPGAIEAALRLARTQAVNQGFDQTRADLATQALRSGSAGMESMGGRLAKARAQALASTMGVPFVEGLQLERDLEAQGIGNNINNYAAMASRASGAPGFAFTPSNAGAQLTQALAQQRGASASSINAGGNMLNAQGNTINSLQLPNYAGMNNPWADLTGLLSTYKDDINSMFKKPAPKREPSTVF